MLKIIKKTFMLALLIMAPVKAEVVLFDLWGVLFKAPMYLYLKDIALTAAPYMICECKNPLKAKDIFGKLFLDTLADVQVEENEEKEEKCEKNNSMASDIRSLPNVMFKWQIGQLNYKDAIQKSINHIKSLDPKKHSDREKKVLMKITELTFDLKSRTTNIRPMAGGIEILKRCAEEKNADGSKRHTLKVVSNMDHEMINYLKTAYPDIFKLFDAIIYSEDVKSMKPNPGIYKAAISKDIDIKDHIFIDDQQENVKGFEDLGGKAILCQDFAKVAKELEELNIISPKKPSYLPSKATRLLGLTALLAASYYYFYE